MTNNKKSNDSEKNSNAVERTSIRLPEDAIENCEKYFGMNFRLLSACVEEAVEETVSVIDEQEYGKAVSVSINGNIGIGAVREKGKVTIAFYLIGEDGEPDEEFFGCMHFESSDEVLSEDKFDDVCEKISEVIACYGLLKSVKNNPEHFNYAIVKTEEEKGEEKGETEKDIPDAVIDLFNEPITTQSFRVCIK